MKKVLLTILVISATGLFASSGASLTKQCIGCHGVDFRQAPLGRSDHTVKTDSIGRMIRMMRYYKHPEESDEVVMKAPVENLTNAQIDVIAKYIYSIK